ncbi:MAG: hypothetical protein COV74_04135 [Candidatus Omnitrophica bacterium CG11_big_fil_rev_8_21_14_0_20_45_26]|uniref:Uncharacterized protein n=1 Tax=Candidatus Abzuiibacterium crystallinum TaxID=1974748 RepID=A0A2H0LQ58_9BACT|nr:MAG: hypothetical protein COV74_04135 [Candidatus Omnitrophica bacterium CG11_big_fil_rev_8_21_14_0_20_45_26]PIW63999.1 MAG: hypothetical protein COW12_08845 [Candidatus Omnitrophica bacterium CG12_big_fil_rev_8_21_14_0_65_45_16]
MKKLFVIAILALMGIGYVLLPTARAGLFLDTPPYDTRDTYEKCVDKHEKRVREACSYLCLYDAPCATACIGKSKQDVIDRNCKKDQA